MNDEFTFEYRVNESPRRRRKGDKPEVLRVRRDIAASGGVSDSTNKSTAKTASSATASTRNLLELNDDFKDANFTRCDPIYFEGKPDI